MLAKELIKHAFLLTVLGFAIMTSSSVLLFAEDALSKVHTYADMEAEIMRNAERHNEGFLSSGWEDFDDTEFVSSLYYELPLSERAVYVAASFAQADLDGEKALCTYS